MESLLRRDRILVVACLLSVTLLSWLFVLDGAGTGMSTLGMTGADLAMGGGLRSITAQADWNAGYALLMFAMWWVMMIAMMLPAAAPTILLFARVHAKQKAAGKAVVSANVFAFGYLSTWAGFSIAATALQWLLEDTGLLSATMASTTPWLGGALLLAAGLWQFTPWKYACLNHCRSPLGFLLSRWRTGDFGAMRMGWEHGAYCLGCCWFLMALLFFGGIMNLYWIGGLGLYVLAEKTIPMGHWLGYALGVGLSIWGAILLIGPIV